MGVQINTGIQILCLYKCKGVEEAIVVKVCKAFFYIYTHQFAAMNHETDMGHENWSSVD